MTGMCDSTGMLIGSTVGCGVLSSVCFDEHAQEQEVRDPDGADVDDDAADDLVDLPADAEPGQQQAHEGRRERGGGDPDEDVVGHGDHDRHAVEGADEELALDRDVEHAAALGQDAGERPERDGHRVLEAAGDDRGQVGGLAVEQAGHDREDPDRDDDQQRAAPRERGRRGRAGPWPRRP